MHEAVVGTSSRVARARRRAGATLAAWCLGLWVGWIAGGSLAPAWLLSGAAALAACGLLSRGLRPWPRRMSGACLLGAVALAAAGWSSLRLVHTPHHALGRVLERVAPEDDRTSRMVVLRLTLLDAPRLTLRDDGAGVWVTRARVRGVVDADASTHKASGIVWLRAPGDAATGWSAGARVLARGTFRAVEGPRNPGAFDLQRWARDRGIEGSFFAPSMLAVRPDESPAAWWERAERGVRSAFGAIRSRAHGVIHASLRSSDEATGQLVRGLLLGEDPQAPLDEVRAFYRVGLAHILTISGFHLAVFAGAVLFAVRLCGDLGRWEPLIVAGCVGLFLVIVPPSSPTLRAAVIVLVLLAGNCIGRRYDRLTLLLWTAVVVLVVRPSELWSLGFQLSFGLTAALLGLSGRLESRLFPPRLGRAALTRSATRGAQRWWRSMLAASLVCWLVSAPWLIVQMGVVNPLALVTGIVVTPLVSVLLWIGYGAVLLGMVVPSLAAGVGALAAKLAGAAGWLVVGADAMPGASIRLAWVSPVWGVVATAWIVVWLRRPRLRRGTMLVGAVALLVWLGLELRLSERLAPGVATEIVRLDTGAARERCVLIRGVRATALVGTGGLSPRSLAAITRELGAATLDAIVFEDLPREDVVAWLRPGRVIVVNAKGAADGPATIPDALASLGLDVALSDLEREPGVGVQVVRRPAAR